MPIKLLGSTSGYLILDAPAIANNATLTLPQSANGAFITTGDINTFTRPQILEVADDSTAALRITQLGTGDAIRVEDDTNPDSSPFVIDANGKVGIGLTLPNARLDVKNTSAGANDIRLSFSSTDYLGFSSQSDGYQIGVTGGSNALRFATGGTERMRITSGGDVGIGASPSYKLDVTATGISIASAFRTDQTEAWIGLKDSGTTFGHVRLGSTSGSMLFYAGNAERMRIDGTNGIIFVGKTSVAATPGAELRPDGIIWSYKAGSTNSDLSYYLYSTSANAYRFYVGLGGTVYAVSTSISAISDQRLKENIRDLDIGLDAILALKPRKFDWKEGKGANIKNARGFIAQEFEQVFPDLIDEWADPAPEGEDPYKSVRQDLIPVLVKAIQELTERVKILESK